MDVLKCVSNSPEKTLALGESIAPALWPGAVVSLEGDLGAGKTVFVKGVARGLGIDPATVMSPTFSLLNEYQAPTPLFHFDAYRITRPEEWEDIGYEDYFRGQGISIVEWGNLIQQYLPRAYLKITIDRGLQPNERIIVFHDEGGGYSGVLARLQREMQSGDFRD